LRNRAKRKNDSSKGKRPLSVANLMPRAVKDSLGGVSHYCDYLAITFEREIIEASGGGSQSSTMTMLDNILSNVFTM
jgi:hypothetical protein